jgi:nucleotide-binding universal stress UspA family protein
MNERILVPLDGSTHAFKALGYACDLAQKYGSAVTLLHVVETRELLRGARRYLDAEDVDEPPVQAYERKIADKVLEEAVRQAQEHGLKDVRKAVEHGNPVRVILRVAEHDKHDLIVMGTRGLSDMRGLAVGSVAHKVSHLAPCTVITVR